MPNDNINIDIKLSNDSLKQVPQLKTSFDLLNQAVKNLNVTISGAAAKFSQFNSQNKEQVSWITKIKDSLSGVASTYNTLRETIGDVGEAFKVAESASGPWSVAITAIFTLVTTYGPEVLEFFSRLFQSEKAAAAAQALRDYSEVMEEYRSNLSGEISQLGMLVNIAGNKSLSQQDRLDAIRQLNNLSPQYLSNLTLENLKTKEGIALLTQYTDSLNKKAMLEAIQTKRTEYTKQRLDLKDKYDNAKQEAMDYRSGKKKNRKVSESTYTPGLGGGQVVEYEINDKKTAEDNYKKVITKDAQFIDSIKRLDKMVADTFAKYSPKIEITQVKNRQYWETQLADQQNILNRMDASAKDYETKAKPIAARIKQAQKILSLYDNNSPEQHNVRISKPKAAKSTNKSEDSEGKTRRESADRMALMELKGYEREIDETKQHFKNLISLHLKNNQTVEQLKKEEAATLESINHKFQKDQLEKLTQYAEQLNNESKSARQQAFDQLEADYKKQITEVDQYQSQNTEIVKKYTEDITAKEDVLNKTTDIKQRAEITLLLEHLKEEKAKAQKIVDEAKSVGEGLKNKYDKNTKALKNSFDQNELKEAIGKDQENGNWKKEFTDRQQLLKLEKQQAVDAAIQKGESVQKVKNDYDAKQRKLDKDRQAAEANQQKQYLQSVDRMATTLGSIFGKNTIAARVAFKAHQAAAAAQVIMDTRTAIMGIWRANSGIPFVGVPKAIAETVIVAATGAANLASIMKQKPGFARGGQYLSDGRGALLPGYSRTDNTNAYLRSGEAVVVSEAMRNPWARNLVSAINVMHGGRDFSVTNPGRGYAIGGIFTDGGNANRYYSQPMQNQQDLANTLAYQMINNFPPIYVDVKDVNNQQNILAQTVNRVNL